MWCFDIILNCYCCWFIQEDQRWISHKRNDWTQFSFIATAGDIWWGKQNNIVYWFFLWTIFLKKEQHFFIHIYLKLFTSCSSYVSNPNSWIMFWQSCGIIDACRPFNLNETIHDIKSMFDAYSFQWNDLANKVIVSKTFRSSISQSNCGQKPISRSRFYKIDDINFSENNSIYLRIQTNLLTFFSLIIISPDVGFILLINIWNVVVLPAPFAPRTSILNSGIISIDILNQT